MKELNVKALKAFKKLLYIFLKDYLKRLFFYQNSLEKEIYRQKEVDKKQEEVDKKQKKHRKAIIYKEKEYREPFLPYLEKEENLGERLVLSFLLLNGFMRLSNEFMKSPIQLRWYFRRVQVVILKTYYRKSYTDIALCLGEKEGVIKSDFKWWKEKIRSKIRSYLEDDSKEIYNFHNESIDEFFNFWVSK